MRGVVVRIIGLLAWFDEPPADLRRAVESHRLCGVSDFMAVDGAYGLFPEAANASPQEQYDVLDARGCVIHQPDRVWESEVEKRAAMFQLARDAFQPSADDWFWVFDADEYVKDPVDLRPVLAGVDEDAASVMLDDVPGGGRTGWARPVRKLFRCLPGLTVGPTHSTYHASGKILWGFEECPARDLRLLLTVTHTTNVRSPSRRAVKLDYYRARDEPLGDCFYCGEPASEHLDGQWVVTPDPTGAHLAGSRRLVCDDHVWVRQRENREDCRRVLTELREVLGPKTWARLPFSVRCGCLDSVEPKAFGVDVVSDLVRSVLRGG